MCGCGGSSSAWTATGASSGAWAASPTKVDGPWLVQRPVYGQVNGVRTVTGFETTEVASYGEADALVRERDTVTGYPRGGGIRRKPAAA